MTQLQAYNNDKKFKAAFVRELQSHAKADEIMQGTYGEERNGKWAGCSVGCGIRSLKRLSPNEASFRDHAFLAAQIGVPAVLQHLNDHIFEGLSKSEAKRWPVRFAKAIPTGADLSTVWNQFAVWLLTDEEHGVRQYAKGYPDVSKAITAVAKLHRRAIAGRPVTADEWETARRAAADAAYAAAYAAYAAAYAYADAAAAAAAAAAAVADAYAYAYAYADAAAAADAAAYAAARKAWYKAASVKLLELISAAG